MNVHRLSVLWVVAPLVAVSSDPCEAVAMQHAVVTHGGGGGAGFGGGFRSSGGCGSIGYGGVHLAGRYPGASGWVTVSPAPRHSWTQHPANRGSSATQWGGRGSLGRQAYEGYRRNYGSMGHRHRLGRGGRTGRCGGGGYGGPRAVGGPVHHCHALDLAPLGDANRPRGGVIDTPWGTRIDVTGRDRDRCVDRVPDCYKYNWWYGFAFLAHPREPWNYPYYYPYYYRGNARYVESYPPVGMVYDGSGIKFETVDVDGETYFVHNGVYYKKTLKDGKVAFEVASPPDEKATGGAAPPAAPASPPAPPDPFDTLEAMCTYLGGLRTFTFAVHDTMDQVDPSGQKVQVSTKRLVDVERPNRIRVRAESVGGDHRVYYRGDRLTLFDRKHNVYGTAKVPARIDEMLDDIVERFGVTPPLVDLLYTDSFQLMIKGIEEGRYLGVHRAGRKDCHHLVFSGPGVEWQIWIAVGDSPVPHKVVIDYLDKDQAPRYIATLTRWQINPSYRTSHFDFCPPKDAKEISVLPLRGNGSE